MRVDRDRRPALDAQRVPGPADRSWSGGTDARRREQHTEEFKARYRVRAGVQGTNLPAVHRSRIRTSRYIGLSKTRLAHLFTATALNLVHLDAWWAGQPHGATRTSHFANLTPALAA
ncbi:transposase [[Actinomadura] parvosata]|uniref:transposase n=1 Tax=[Actinomadura] parvosata TaxID=1955412 RepID=UPI00406C91D8